MIGNIIGGFVCILVGCVFTGTLANLVNQNTGVGSDLYNSSTWGSNVLSLVPGFYALTLLSVGIAVCYSTLYQAGIL